MSIDMQSVEISQLFSAGFACDLEGVEHRKTLPCLSVVQALHGYYEIGLDHKGAGIHRTGRRVYRSGQLLSADYPPQWKRARHARALGVDARAGEHLLPVGGSL